MKTAVQTTCGRPKGVRFDSRIDLRIPKPMLACVQKRAREKKVSACEYIRMCIEQQFGKESAGLITMVRDEKTSDYWKLYAIRRLHELRNAVTACSELGLKIARAKAK